MFISRQIQIRRAKLEMEIGGVKFLSAASSSAVAS